MLFEPDKEKPSQGIRGFFQNCRGRRGVSTTAMNQRVRAADRSDFLSEK